MSTHENKQEISQEPVRVELGERSYDIRFYYDKPQKLAGELRAFIPERALVVSNDTIWKLHGERLVQALGQAGVEAGVALIGDGEKYKTLQSAEKLYDTLISGRFSRHSCLIAFGGGVVGDLTGFVAATFMRGIRFLQIPTTVVAMVDSSVGGKTAVDHPLGKNLIGAFYQPKLVAIDLGYLKTLDSHNIRGGFGEIIKYGMILDRDFFDYLERHLEAALALEPKALTHLVRRSCELKAQVVIQDEHESGLRAILNYGHTFAHAIESLGEYMERQFHGQAVAIGMVLDGQAQIPALAHLV